MGRISEFFAVVLGAALICGGVVGVYMIGASSLRMYAFIFVSGVVVAILIAASALPIRAYRKRDATGETHHYHEGVITKETRILDGRVVEGPKILQLPAAPQSEGFPELLRAAWQAGSLGHQVNVEPIETDTQPGHWDGEITP